MENKNLLVNDIISAVENIKTLSSMRAEAQRLESDIQNKLNEVEGCASFIEDGLSFIEGKSDNEDTKSIIDEIFEAYFPELVAIHGDVTNEDCKFRNDDTDILDSMIGALRAINDDTSVSDYREYKERYSNND